MKNLVKMTVNTIANNDNALHMNLHMFDFTRLFTGIVYDYAEPLYSFDNRLRC